MSLMLQHAQRPRWLVRARTSSRIVVSQQQPLFLAAAFPERAVACQVSSWLLLHSSTAAKSTLISPTAHENNNDQTLGNKTTFVADVMYKPADMPVANWRIKTSTERMKQFPKNVMSLWHSCLHYKDVHDASKTPLNAWSIRHVMPQRHNIGFQLYKDRPGRIPRRQYQELRQFRDALGVVVPLVLIWIPPIIGYLPMILAITAPRQVLSRHFHNDYEIVLYAQKEYKQREREYNKLTTEYFCRHVGMDVEDLAAAVVAGKEDAAGPILDSAKLFSVFAKQEETGNLATDSLLPKGVLHTANACSRYHLITLALASGIHQTLPGWASIMITNVALNFWLRLRIRQSGKAVCMDDVLLLSEKSHEYGCRDLTDVEVMDACLMRGLPITKITYDEMRECLTNHLNMIQAVHDALPVKDTTDDVDKSSSLHYQNEAWALFTLHLTPLRYYLKHSSKK